MASPLYDNPRSPKDDPLDYTDQYNTKLSADEEKAYRKWAKEKGRERDTYDYDMRGAWKEGIDANEEGHFPDTYKKPNHPSFSDESQYHGKDGHKGGKWSRENGRDKFSPGETNLKMHGRKGLIDYFSDKARVGDTTDLVLPEDE